MVVCCKQGAVRPSLAEIQEAVSTTLHPAKWPQLIVYMDHGLPLTSTNKVRAKRRQIMGLVLLQVRENVRDEREHGRGCARGLGGPHIT